MLEVESALYASLLNAVFHHCLSKNESEGDVESKHPKELTRLNQNSLDPGLLMVVE